MASILKVDDLRGKTAAGNITITNGSATMQLSKGLNTAWWQINAQSGAAEGSFNIASTSDNGTGSFSQNFTNNMNDQNYPFTATGGHDNNTTPGTTTICMHKAVTSGTRIRITNSGGSVVDESQCNGITAGDLA